jgi:hypothetical protein
VFRYDVEIDHRDGGLYRLESLTPQGDARLVLAEDRVGGRKRGRR